MSTAKAVKATIVLGDISLACYQMPDGSYRISSTDIANALGMSEKSFLPNFMSKELKALLEASPRFVVFSEKVAFEGNNVKINAIDLTLAGLIFQHYAFKGNPKAFAICTACMSEALERRADAAFNVLRDEQERNLRFVARRDGILSRHFWTDTIKAYIDANSDSLSENYKRFVYINVSDYVNKTWFGMSAKQIRDALDLPTDDLIRDYVPSELLKSIDTMEKAAALRSRNLNLDPYQALKDVAGMLQPEPDSSWVTRN